MSHKSSKILLHLFFSSRTKHWTFILCIILSSSELSVVWVTKHVASRLVHLTYCAFKGFLCRSIADSFCSVIISNVDRPHISWDIMIEAFLNLGSMPKCIKLTSIFNCKLSLSKQRFTFLEVNNQVVEIPGDNAQCLVSDFYNGFLLCILTNKETGL